METAESNLYIQYNPLQNSNNILLRGRKINPNVPTEAQKILNSQSDLNKKSNAGVITILDFKLYYRTIATKVAW
jgi:hypothetical protein